jgi:hypothetical protein
MAETVLLDGSNYEFEIFILNFLENNEYQVVPIAKSNIKYLEVTNDLVNMGYVGKVAFTNFYNVLQKLQLFTSSVEAPYMYIYFKNLDFNATKTGSSEVFLTASLQKGQEYNVNSIDGSIYYEFEELSIARLKRTKVVYSSSSTGDILKNPDRSPVSAIKSFFENGISDSKVMDGTISTALTEIRGDENKKGIINDITQITNVTNQHTYYDIIERLYSYASFTTPTKIEGYYSPAIIQLENDNVKKKRKLVISSLLDTIRNFFDKIKNNPTDEKMKDYLLERFNIAQTGDSPYFSDNYLDKYELKRVNYEDVFENKWTTIELVCETVECVDQYQIDYDKLRAAFENMATAPFASNLPSRKEDVDASMIKEVQYSRPGIDGILAQVYGTNKVFKSFIFDNLAITFRTKGQPYRSPGKFITIKTDNVDVNSKKNKNLSEVDGHWFVISVSHVFENDVYFNDFICVKIYNPAGKLSDVPPPPKTPVGTMGAATSDGTGSSTSRGSVNSGDGFPALPTEANNTGAAGGSVSNQAFTEQLKRSDRLQYLEQNSAESLKFFDSFEFGGSAEVSRVEIMNDIALGDYNKALQTFNTIPGFAQRAFDARVNNYFTSSGGYGVLPSLEPDRNALPPLD